MLKLVKLSLLTLGFALSLNGMAQASFFFTHPVSPEVKTLRRIVDGDFMKLPVIDLDVRSSVEISFDVLGDEERWISYRVIHCTADWTASEISELDYLEGFQPTRVTDVAPSFNTFVPYYHYRIAFPNEDVRLLLSGNYAMEFFYDDNPDEPIAVATFSVLEPLMSVSGTVDANTDIDYKSMHQQLTCALSWPPTKFPYMDPAADLTLKVRQNNRRDNERTICRPSRMQANKAFYEHNADLIFPGGNNFRRFEFTDKNYSSIGVDRIAYHAPYYYVWLQTDREKSGRSYYYDRDQHGRFLVHALRVEDTDLEADYFMVRFDLSTTLRTGSGGIFLYGDFTYGIFDKTTEMVHDPLEERLQQTMLLKQGAYNYMYLVGNPASGGGMRTAPIEGDYYETPNQYSIYVYYRPAGQRYDRLVGFSIF